MIFKSKTFVFIALAILWIGIFYRYWYPSEMGSAIGISKEIQDETGKPINWDAFAGKNLIVHLWASWCAPCIDEIPRIKKMAEELKSKSNMEFVLIGVQDEWSQLNKIIDSKSISGLPIFLYADLDGKFSEKLGTFQYPETYWVGSDFKILKKWIGPQDWKAIIPFLPSNSIE